MRHLAFSAALLAAAGACGDEGSDPAPLPEPASGRLTSLDVPLEILRLAAPSKNWPPAATSTVTMTLRAQVTPPTVGGNLLYASSVAVSGSLALVSYHRPGPDYGGGVDIIDVTDPGTPQLLSSLSLPGEDVNAAASDGSRLYLAVSSDAFPFPETAAVRAYDLLNDRIQPASAQIQALSSFIATEVTLNGARLFATTGNTNGHVIELDPATLSVTSSVAIEDARSVSFVGGQLAVHRGDAVELLDSATMAPVASWSFPTANSADARAQVLVSGEKAFVTAGSEGVHVLDTSSGTVLDSIAVPEFNALGLLPAEVVANGLALVRDKMFIAQGGGGFHLAYTDRHPDSLTAGVLDPYEGLSSITFSDWESSNAVASSEDVVVVANGVGGVRLIELNHLADTTIALGSSIFGTTPSAPIASITFTATVTNAPLPVERVEFLAGSAKIGEDATAPYELTITNATGAYYDFAARAIFVGGYAKTSTVQHVDVDGTFRKVNFGLVRSGSPEDLFTMPVGFYEDRGGLPTGYEVDIGEVYGARAASFDYGWSADRTNRIYIGHNKFHPDRRHLESIRMRNAGTEWEMDLPAGDYFVRTAAGYNSWKFRPIPIHISAEGTDILNFTTTNEAFFDLGEISSLNVSDGRLTLRNETGSGNTCLLYAEALTAGVDYQPPSRPTELSADLLNANSTTLHWRSSADNMSVSHYNIYVDDALVGQEPGPRGFLNDLEEGESYLIEVSAVDLHDNESERSEPLLVMTSTEGRALAVETAAGIRADGNAAEVEWSLATAYPIDNVQFNDGVGDTPSGPSDLSATIKFMWSPTHLFTLIEVTDDALQTDDMTAAGDGVASSSDDHVQIYFDFDNMRSLGYAADTLQLFVGYDSDLSRDNDLDGDGSTVQLSTAAQHYGTAATTNGWILEMALPWSLIDTSGALTPAAGTRFGFEIQVGDDDDGGGREYKIGWNESLYDGAWTSPRLMGTVELVE